MVQLPLDSQEIREKVALMILQCVQPTDDDQPATITMTSVPTNVGNEVHFTFENAHFCKRGKRRLKKVFLNANKAWTAAKESLFFAWKEANQGELLSAQVEQICKTDPALANDLQISFQKFSICKNCNEYHAAHPEIEKLEGEFKDLNLRVLFLSDLNSPGVINIHDKDGVISASPFRKAIVQRLQKELTTMVKQGMVEFMLDQEKQVVRHFPSEMLRNMQGFVSTMDQMKAMGLQLEPGLELLGFVETLRAMVSGKPFKKAAGEASSEHNSPFHPSGANTKDGSPPN